jgi:hypothetical protein
MISEKEIVDLFLKDKEFQKIVENDLGKSIKVKVDWNKRTISVKGIKSGRELNIDDIVNSYLKGGGFQ